MQTRNAVSLVAAAITCVGAVASAIAFSSSSAAYPLEWELLTTLPLLCLQLLSMAASWRLPVAPRLKTHLLLALVLSSLSLFVSSGTLLVVTVAGLALAPESRVVVLVLIAMLFVLPLSSLLNARACWQAILSLRSNSNEA
jgi:hypothetical protein